MINYKRIERKNKKLEKESKSARSVYLVVRWAKWCVLECKWTGILLYRDDVSWIMPEVYHFTDHNGEFDEWYTCPACNITSGEMYDWTFNKRTAEMIAETLNVKDKSSTEVKFMSKEEEMEEFFKHYA